jgi:hypothetical protein
MEVRSAPPVLQGIKKVSSACQLRWDVRRSSALSPEVKLRLAREKIHRSKIKQLRRGSDWEE